MTAPDYSEILAECRAKCREIEQRAFVGYDAVTLFKYTTRSFWWEYLQKSQKGATFIITFREFWDNEDTYSRTVEMVKES